MSFSYGSIVYGSDTNIISFQLFIRDNAAQFEAIDNEFIAST